MSQPLTNAPHWYFRLLTITSRRIEECTSRTRQDFANGDLKSAYERDSTIPPTIYEGRACKLLKHINANSQRRRALTIFRLWRGLAPGTSTLLGSRWLSRAATNHRHGLCLANNAGTCELTMPMFERRPPSAGSRKVVLALPVFSI